MPRHKTYAKLIQDISAKDSPVLMFDGYSGTGYAHAQLVKMHMKMQAVRFMKEFGLLPDGADRNAEPLYIVAGATRVGIGAVYEIADSLKAEGFNIRTVGIVSEEANKYPDDLHPGLDYYVDVADPAGNWQVLMEDGNSYMIDVLKHSSHAKASFMGGGKVARSELEDLERFAAADPDAARHIEIEIRRGGVFAPDPVQVEKQIAKADAKGQTLSADDYQFYGTNDFQQGVTSGGPVRATSALTHDAEMEALMAPAS